jgi:translation initiation factor 3 subunit I
MAQNGDLLYNAPVHELNAPVTDLQWSRDRTYFITASKDKTAKVRRPPSHQSPPVPPC